MMNQIRTKVASLTLMFLVLLLGLSGGVVLDRQVLPVLTQHISPADKLDVGVLNEAWNTIQNYYVDEGAVQGQPLTDAALNGMVDALGDTGHSRYMSPATVKASNNFDQGQIEGIGAEIDKKDGKISVIAPMDNSPAQKAGLQPGDVILKVNGQDVSGAAMDQVMDQVAGPAGSAVTLTVTSPNSKTTREVTIVRQLIMMRNISWLRLPGTKIAHLRIAAFSRGVSDDLKQALEQIQADGDTGIILDLRNNPGGLLDETISTTSMFLKDGDVLLMKNSQGQIKHVPVESSSLTTDIPMVVLVDKETASGAEIMSGALQDAGRAKLVGQTTYGTGTVLAQFPLSNGGALLLATQEWLTPKGNVIWHKGIVPDVVVALPDGVSALMPKDVRNLSAAQLRGTSDKQLLRAIQLLEQHK